MENAGGFARFTAEGRATQTELGACSHSISSGCGQ